MLAPQLEAELNDRRSEQTIRDQVKKALKPMLAGQRPSIVGIAKELNLSARTLQRRLTEAGVTFQQILEEARRELARHYLLQSSLELNETAYLLGYENANSFFRAFRDWEGISPGQWRNSYRLSPQSSHLNLERGAHRGLDSCTSSAAGDEGQRFSGSVG